MIDLTQLHPAGETPDLVLGHTAKVMPCDRGSVEHVGDIEVWMRPLTGKDDRALINASVKSTKKGRQKFAGAGEAAAARLKRAVTKLRATELSVGGKPLSRLDDETYDVLPRWVLERMRAKQTELQGDAEIDLDEDDDEPVGDELEESYTGE